MKLAEFQRRTQGVDPDLVSRFLAVIVDRNTEFKTLDSHFAEWERLKDFSHLKHDPESLDIALNGLFDESLRAQQAALKRYEAQNPPKPAFPTRTPGLGG